MEIFKRKIYFKKDWPGTKVSLEVVKRKGRDSGQGFRKTHRTANTLILTQGYPF